MASRDSHFYATLMAAGGGASGVAAAAAANLPGLAHSAYLSYLASFVVGTGVTAGTHYLHYYSTVRVPQLPALRWIGSRLCRLDLHDRVLFDKIVGDLDLSPLGRRRDVLLACSDIVLRGRHLGFPSDLAEQIERVVNDHPEQLAASQPAGRDDVGPLMRLQRPISVLCLSLQPAVTAALLDMKQRLGIPLELETGVANGVVAAEWMARGLADGCPYDVALLPSSVFFLASQQAFGVDIGRAYSLLAPVYEQDQHVIRRSRCSSPADNVRFLASSSAEEMVRMLRYLGYSRFKERPYGSGDKFELAELDENEAFVAWPPLNRIVLAHWGFKRVDSYRLWMCLYMLEQAFSDLAVRRALVTAFTASWRYCRDNPDYAIALFYSQAKARADFLRALRCQIGGF